MVSRWGGRCCASILPPPRTPALDKEAPAEPCPHCRRSRAGSFRRQRPGSRWNRQPRLCRLHSAVRLRRVSLYLPAIPPHHRRGEPRRKCSGRVGGSRSQLFNCFRLLAQRMSGGAFGGLWPPRLIALSAHNHAFASARHPLRRWEPFSLGFAHRRYPFDSALSRAQWARTPEAVCAHILPVFAGGREPGVSRPLYRQSPPSLTRRCYRPPPGPRSTRFARSAPLVVWRLWTWSPRQGSLVLQRHHPLYRPGPETPNHQGHLFTHARAVVLIGAECPARGTVSDIKIFHFWAAASPLPGALIRCLVGALFLCRLCEFYMLNC